MLRSISVTLLTLALLSVAQIEAQARIDHSVVQITVHSVSGDRRLPWNTQAPQQSSGSGFVIDGNRILTNAHVVENARLILVRLNGDPTPYEAKVLATGHDCDLALLTLTQQERLKSIPALPIGDLPAPGSEVATYGFPMGGQRISATRGIVSRIERTSYSHTQIDAHLTVQTDAAINPGNSGGPVVQAAAAIGVAFQTHYYADGIGYFIPTEVIRHFLDDASDGDYLGYPGFGAKTATMHNPAARRRAGLAKDQSGVQVDAIQVGGSANGNLARGDILLSIDGQTIANDGTVAFGSLRVDYRVLVDRHQIGDKAEFEVLRDGKPLTIEVLMRRHEEARYRIPRHDKQQRYFVYGGFVFMPLTTEMINSDPSYRHAAKVRAQRDPNYAAAEIIVLARRLEHEVNRSVPFHSEMVIEKVNGKKIRRLEDLIEAIESQQGNFQVFDFAYAGRFAVLDRKAVEKANPEILKRYGVPGDRRL